MTSLEKQRILVTGGGSGTGAAIAQRFASAGHEVVICGRRAHALASVADANPLIRAVPADVTDEGSVEDLFRQAGPCGVVIANAGAASSSPIGKTTLSEWNQMLAVNLTGVFLTLRAGLEQLPDGRGRLIAVASTAGLKGYRYVAPYVAAKHGVVGLVRALAVELGARDVTVNAICPGFIDSEMTQRSIDVITERTGRSADEARAALTSANPQGRLIEPGEVADLAYYLASDNARSVTGQALSLSGGET